MKAYDGDMLPVDAQDPAGVVAPQKPRYRGRLHQCTFWLSLPAIGIVWLMKRPQFAGMGAAAPKVEVME